MNTATYDLPVKDMRDFQIKPAIFLDFDGTIRTSKSGKRFIQDKNDIELCPTSKTFFGIIETTDI